MQRLQRAREAVLAAPGVGGNLLRLAVGDLVSRSPVAALPDLPVREAAALMTRERVSSLLVVRDGTLLGIVTDRDLRARCVAGGLDGGVPLRQVMTPEPRTIARTASAFDALMLMSRLQVHHLPVVDGDGVHGLISTHDLLRAQSANPLYVADRIRRCRTAHALREAAAETRELQLQFVAANATAQQLGQAITSVCDAVTVRLLELAFERLGEPPVPFAWIATGSQGRGELTLHSDQDNSIILDDAYSPVEHAQYFATLAKSVNDDLDACGYANCPGDVMASNARWRQPVGTWRAYFSEWLEHTDHKAATLAANFFDMRTVWGPDSLRQHLMDEILPRCREDAAFQAYLSAHALGNRPPLGFLRHFVVVRSGEHEGAMDLKLHGLLPIVDLARVYALASGMEAVGTQQRLRPRGGAREIERGGSGEPAGRIRIHLGPPCASSSRTIAWQRRRRQLHRARAPHVRGATAPERRFRSDRDHAGRGARRARRPVAVVNPWALLSLELQRRRLARTAPAGPLRSFYLEPLLPATSEWREVPFLAVDLETTGRDARTEETVSVGCVEVRHSTIDLSTAARRMVRTSRSMPERSAVIHSITDDEAASGELRLDALRARHGRPRHSSHDALSDALATAELFLAQMEELGAAGPVKLKALLAHRS